MLRLDPTAATTTTTTITTTTTTTTTTTGTQPPTNHQQIAALSIPRNIVIVQFVLIRPFGKQSKTFSRFYLVSRWVFPDSKVMQDSLTSTNGFWGWAYWDISLKLTFLLCVTYISGIFWSDSGNGLILPFITICFLSTWVLEELWNNNISKLDGAIPCLSLFFRMVTNISILYRKYTNMYVYDICIVCATNKWMQILLGGACM